MTEKFYADTGANRSIHPNGRSAITYCRQTLDISTANVGKGMQSEGVGKMLLYAPNGNQFPGFDQVVFAKNTSAKLAAVGELCDAGMVCVFDKDGLRTYSISDCKVEGKIFTEDARDKRTKLYPLTLFRKKKETNDVEIKAALATCYKGLPLERKFFAPEPITEKLPASIPVEAELPQLNLAHTYIKEGLSEIDRLHAKCGDVGIKYLKRAFPELKVPKNYRCKFCIEGKIHKFCHSACAPGRRTVYLPGQSIAADHAGPYAVSTGGSKYSELFIDEGSDYLFAFRQKSKTDHYRDLPQVIAECRALSGRPLQIFRSDGDGTFKSAEHAEIMLKEKIRHEFGAPHDSDTNPKVERARRTILEGVCTALLRANAPASFWGEAEAHKIYTINNLPTQPDPKNPGKFISRWNLLTGSERPLNLARLQAFGTMVTCYIPVKARHEGKHPGQRRSFQGALLGYEGNSPCYRIWDLAARKVRIVSYNFTICHEGYYPFREKENWPPACFDDPILFSPINDGILSTREWSKYKFDMQDTKEIFAKSPGLVVDCAEDLSLIHI